MEKGEQLTSKTIAVHAAVIIAIAGTLSFLGDKFFYSRTEGLLAARQITDIAGALSKTNEVLERVKNDQRDQLDLIRKVSDQVISNTQRIEQAATVLQGIQNEQSSRSTVFTQIIDSQRVLADAMKALNESMKAREGQK